MLLDVLNGVFLPFIVRDGSGTTSQGTIIDIISGVKKCDTLSCRVSITLLVCYLSFLFISSSTRLIVSIIGR